MLFFLVLLEIIIFIDYFFRIKLNNIKRMFINFIITIYDKKQMTININI